MQNSNKTKRNKLVIVGFFLILILALPAMVTASHGGSSSTELNFVSQLDLGIPGENVTDVWAYGNHAYLGTWPDESGSAS